MTLILVILIVLLICGGGFYGYRGVGGADPMLSGPGPGIIGLIVVILLIWLLLGHGHI